MQKNDMDTLSISSVLLIEEAKKRGYDIEMICKEKNLFYIIIHSEKKVLCKNIDVGLNSSLGYKITEDKELTYRILEKQNITVPRSVYVSLNEKDTFNYDGYEFPYVVKPIDGAHGDGVTANIITKSELKIALEKAFLFSSDIIIQNHIVGNDFRFLVVGESVVAVAMRLPPSVVGDGIKNISQLIDIENTHPLRGKGNHTSPMSQILFDDESKKYIKTLGYDETSILEKGKQIFLRSNANLSTGGVSINVTDRVHANLKDIAVFSVKSVGLKIAGVDIITSDITKPLHDTHGAVIEINSTPGLRMHHFPSEGAPINVVSKILDQLI